eukprot:360251-Chlamydomonas_euryale.AAC.3
MQQRPRAHDGRLRGGGGGGGGFCRDGRNCVAQPTRSGVGGGGAAISRMFGSGRVEKSMGRSAMGLSCRAKHG